MNFMKLFLGFVTITALTGCIDTHNPFATLRSLVYSANKSKLEDYKACFAKSVRDEMGTQEKMEALKTHLANAGKLKMGPAVLTYVEQGYQGWGAWGDILRKFEVSALTESGETVIATEQVCAVWVDRVMDTHYCGDIHRPDCDGQYRLVEAQDCRIVSLAHLE